MTRKLLTLLCCSVASFGTACAAESPSTTNVQKETANAKLVATSASAEQSVMAPDAAWRDLDPENTLYIDTDHGRMVVELYPEIAPLHVDRIKTLTRQSFYDHIVFHRVIKDFMNQTGDPKGDGTGDSDLPDLQAESTYRRSADMPVTLFSIRPNDPRKKQKGQIDVGFYKSLPIATDPIGQAILTKDGKVGAYGLHCKGVTSMARSGLSLIHI